MILSIISGGMAAETKLSGDVGAVAVAMLGYIAYDIASKHKESGCCE